MIQAMSLTTTRLLRPAAMLALTVALVGCGGEATVAPTISYETGGNGIQAGYVRIVPTATGLAVDNQTSRPIYLMAANAETLALLDWVPCTGGAGCAPLAQGQTREIPWAVALSYEASTRQYAVYWWNVITHSDGSLRADNIHNVIVSR